MRTILIIFVLTFSNVFSQNKFSSFSNHKLTLEFTNNNHISHYSFDQSDKLASHKHSFINLAGQALVGSALAVGFFVPTLTLSIGLTWDKNINEPSQTALGILSLSSYVFGAAVGVYWVAKSENPKLSFWKTVGYSAIGAGVGVVIVSILATQFTKIPTVGGSIAALSPIIGAMVYTSFISDWPQSNEEVSFYKDYFSHKDLVEQSKLFNIELFRIQL